MNINYNPSLKQKIINPDTSYVVDLSSQSSSLVIGLGGGLGRVGMPMEDFAEVLLSINSKRVFMRDLLQMYYLFGVPGIGDNIEQIAGWFRNLIKQEKITHVTTFGNCMGGHIAILLGVLLDADVVHAFYPKSTIKWHHRLYYRDFPPGYLPKNMVFRTNFARFGNWKYLDLKEILRKHSEFKGVINIYAKMSKPLTMLHANRLAEFPQVRVHTQESNKAEILRNS